MCVQEYFFLSVRSIQVLFYRQTAQSTHAYIFRLFRIEAMLAGAGKYHYDRVSNYVFYILAPPSFTTPKLPYTYTMHPLNGIEQVTPRTQDHRQNVHVYRTRKQPFTHYRQFVAQCGCKCSD